MSSVLNEGSAFTVTMPVQLAPAPELGGKGGAAHAHEAGMDGHLSKPIDIDKVFAVLDRYLLQADIRPMARRG